MYDYGPGDIIEFFSATSGYPKYHLCVLSCSNEIAGIFLYLNSRAGFDSDYVLDDSEIPCLPTSLTGKTIVSFSQPLRRTRHQLQLFEARKRGVLSPPVARKLEVFAKSVPTLTNRERTIVLDALAAIK